MNIFTFIKSRVSILDVIGSYATLKKAGHYYKSQCLFHNEKTASFTVSPHKEIFYCFGCHLSGDVISFIAKIENCTQLEAAQFLAERYQIELPETLNSEQATVHKKKYYELCELISNWCFDALKKNNTVIQYLTNRNITQKSINYFQIGYFPGGLQSTKQFIHDMAKHHVLVEDLVNAHFLVSGKNILYSPFEERILFPIKDHLGRFCGFGGRIYKAQDTRPKYYNSRENEFFAKGALLFGLDLAKKEIQKQENVYLVEGYTDCVAMVQHGYANTVATLGTACTLDHLKQLARYAATVYVLYDGDKAGQQAVLRLANLCWQATIDLKVITLPAQEDPASFLSKSHDLKPLIEKSQDIFLFFIESLGAGYKNKGLSEKLQLTRRIIEPLAMIQDQLKKDILLAKASEMLDIPISSLKKGIAANQTNEQIERVAPEAELSKQILPKQPPAAANLPKLEKKIFFAIMNNIQLLNRENAWYLITFLPQPLRDIVNILHKEKEKDPSLDFIHFFDTLSEIDQHFVSKILLEENQHIEEKTFDALLTQLQKNHWKVIVNDIKLKIEHAKKERKDEQVKELLNEFLNLRKKLIGKELI